MTILTTLMVLALLSVGVAMVCGVVKWRSLDANITPHDAKGGER